MVKLCRGVVKINGQVVDEVFGILSRLKGGKVRGRYYEVQNGSQDPRIAPKLFLSQIYTPYILYKDR